MQSEVTIPPAARPTALSTETIELSRIHPQVVRIDEAEERGLITDTAAYPTLSRWKTLTIISTVTGITILNSMQNGIVTVGLPTIGRDLQLSENLILWYPTQ
jgi:hypothetical protein